MKILAIIPAREGSKGIKDKNVQPLCNKPLIYWSISEARKAAVDRVIVSTDSTRYVDILTQYGQDLFPFVRPDRLAKDKTPSSDVVIHALDWLEKNEGIKYDLVVLLEPTSPLRTAEQINEAIHLLKNNSKAKALVSVCESKDNPLIAFELTKDNILVPYGTNGAFPGHPQRQAMRPAYFMSGDIYVSDVPTYRKTRTFDHDRTIGYVLPVYHKYEVDDPHDLVVIEALMKWRTRR